MYVWLAIVVVFSIWVPDTFPTTSTVKQVLNANSITALAALSITVPLAARVFVPAGLRLSRPQPAA